MQFTVGLLTMRAICVICMALFVAPASVLAAYTHSVSLLTTIGASTSGSCDMNFDAACSISSAASLNVAVTAALNSARSALELSRVMGDVSAGRYTAPVVPSSNAFYPEAPCIPRVQCMAPAVQ